MKTLCVIIALLLPGVAFSDCGAKRGFPKPEQYPAGELYRGKVHALVLDTSLARRFHTTISWSMEDGVNFDGHFVVAKWGCGTGCLQFAVVDAINGKVYAPPFSNVEFHHPFVVSGKWPDFDPEGKWWCKAYAENPTFNANSTLMVVEGCIGQGQCGRTFFEMTPRGLKQVHFDPDRSPDGNVAPP
jgi:hypothetical protein